MIQEFYDVVARPVEGVSARSLADVVYACADAFPGKIYARCCYLRMAEQEWGGKKKGKEVGELVAVLEVQGKEHAGALQGLLQKLDCIRAVDIEPSLYSFVHRTQPIVTSPRPAL